MPGEGKRREQNAEYAEPGILSGTRPEGARDEREAGERVQAMFSRIAPRYDFLNHFLSASCDRIWRRRAAEHFRHLLERPDARILDLCCGTGDLIFALERAAKPFRTEHNPFEGKFLGVDFAFPMLGRAREKGSRGGFASAFLAGDALCLPFGEGSFDLVTLAFGFRNLANYESGLREIVRILRPGGEVGILDFCEPPGGALAALYRFYFGRLLPRVGGAISGHREAYSYLPGSVRKFPRPEILAAWMRKAGLADVRFERWTGGIVALHRALRR